MPRRREFLQQSAAALGAAAFSGKAAAESGDGWYNRPMRWAQLTLVEDDPGNYDPQFWLDYFSRTHSDAACLSAGGCVAYYPTKVPLHYRSKFLGERDPFGELVAGCRKLGMDVIARTDPHAVHQDVYDAHPDWIAVDAQGSKRRHWAIPELWVTCALGPYNFEFMTEVTNEIVSPLPGGRHLQQPLGRLGHVLLRALPEKLQDVLRARSAAHGEPAGPGAPAVYSLAPAAAVRAVAAVGPRDQEDQSQRELHRQRRRRRAERPRYEDHRRTGADAVRRPAGAARPHAPLVERQERQRVPRHDGPQSHRRHFQRGRRGAVPLEGLGAERRRDPAVGGWTASRNGLRPWFTKFNGKLHDQRWLKVVEDLYGWHYRNERYLRNESSLARVAMVYSQQTAYVLRRRAGAAKVEDHALGFYQALVEARIPFEMVHDRLLDAEHIGRYKHADPAQHRGAFDGAMPTSSRNLCARGGNLVATHETSLYDEWGVRRSDFGLASICSARRLRGRVETDMHNSYLNVDKDPPTGRLPPDVRGLEDAKRIINGVNWVHTRPALSGNRSADAGSVLSGSADGAGVCAGAADRHPGVYAREEGKGRVVYFPFDIDRTFWEVLSGDHGMLLRNAVAGRTTNRSR